MKPFFFGVQDFFGRWAIDDKGVQSGAFTARDLRRKLDQGEISAHTWVRHIWTKRFSLVGEILYSNGQANIAEFEDWFPEPSLKAQVPPAITSV